ncbi:7TM diverse intracellular signaling domain-containing protein [Aliikangiella sp. IMCC44632]
MNYKKILNTCLVKSLIACILIIAAPLNALEIKPNSTRINLYADLAYFEDPTGQLTFEQVKNEEFKRASQSNETNLAFGYSDSTYWVKTNVTNLSGHSNWIIELSYPLLDSIEFYFVDSSQLRNIVTGDQLPFSQRPIEHRNFLFPFNLDSNKSLDIYIKVQSSSSIRLPLTLWEQQTFFENDQKRLLGQGIYFGILIIMMLYNLFIYFSIKERAYLHYVFYVASYIVVQASLNGIAFQYLFTDLIHLSNQAVVLGLSLVILFGCSFTVNFLNLKYHNQLAFNVIYSIGVIGGLNFLLSMLLPYDWTIKIALFFSVIGSLAITVFSLTLWLSQNVREARYFSLAWIGFLAGSILMVLNRVQILPDNFITENAAQLGSSIEVMLLSFALADKFNQIRGEKEQVKTKAQASITQVNHLLQETLARLEYSNKIKNDFLATVSHELRTPMNGIVGANELLGTLNLTDEAQEFVEISRESADQMMRLIDSMLQFVELQAGASKIKKVKVDYKKLCNELNDYAQSIQINKKVKFRVVEPEENLDSLYTDLEKLLVTIKVLIDNALKYTHSGMVEVSIESTQHGADSFIVFNVKDTGIGIEKAHLARIFEVFSQVDSTLRRPYSGLGIGLTIAQAIANVLGGKISAESQLAKGSCFKFIVPTNLDLAAKQ